MEHARCRVTIDAQTAFAALSGDANPLHTDELEARRLLFGGVVVHGVHLVLWALENIVAGRGTRAASQIKVKFERPVSVGEPVSLSYHLTESGLIRATVRGRDAIVIRLSLEEGEAQGTEWLGGRDCPAQMCEEPAPATLHALRGGLDLTLPATWQAMFPRLADRFSWAQVAVLLATTRLVGMVCPGRHSVYSGFALSFDRDVALATRLEFSVRSFDQRFGMVDMDVVAPGVKGTVSSLLRPAPVQQQSCAELAALLSRGEFEGQRAVVVGGSRGLGELAAKILAVGGADVTITYARGRADAERVAEDVVASKHRIQLGQLDVLRDESPRIPGDGVALTHLYYFSTPPIRENAGEGFNSEYFDLLLKYYATGFSAMAYWFRDHATSSGVVWFPSTAFIDDEASTFPEYVAAKRCGEALCHYLDRRLAPLRIVFDRLPHLLTDQTQGLSLVPVPDGASTLLTILRRMHRKA
jgi:acyl dehydratase